jgi:hypothetical protein
MRSRLWAFGMVMALIGGGGAQAQHKGPSQQGVLVELFTSQGCSACPPADALLQDLTRLPGVIPLALHVDYWDYIGWRDTFAQAAFSQRQRHYAAAAADRMVYTPQMIVAGAARIKGYDAGELREQIGAVQAQADLTLQRQGDQLLITARPTAPLTGPFVVDLVRYRPQTSVAIARGENAGLQITYHNIVTNWDRLAEWSGQTDLSLSTRTTGPAPVVVLIQRQGPAQVIAAAVLK